MPTYKLISEKLNTAPIFWSTPFIFVVVVRFITTWGLYSIIGSSTILFLLPKFLLVCGYHLLVLWLRTLVNWTFFLITVWADNIKISTWFVANMSLAHCAKATVSINSLTQNFLNLLKHISFMSISDKGFHLSLLQKKFKHLHKVRYWTVCQTCKHINHCLIR